MSLVVAEAWTRVVDEADDRFADMRPATATCDEAGFYLDPLTRAFEVDTGLCDYLTIEQPAGEALSAGDVVRIAIAHGDLTAPTPSEGYVGLAFDDEIVWEYATPIPAPADTFEAEFEVRRDVALGGAIQVHVHNHGANTWELTSLKVAHRSECR
ncbi:MAG: hypothetical protein R3A79_26710 [Nannocystaceae bacterium]